MKDEDIDYSDIPPLNEKFFTTGTLRMPKTLSSTYIRIDADILEWFQAQQENSEILINEVLRRYVISQTDSKKIAT